MKNKVLFVLLVVFVVVLGGSLCFKQLTYASWIESDAGKQYENEDGEIAKGFTTIDDERYYFDEDGYLVTGKFFCEEDQSYYYANKKGVIQTGYIKTKKTFYVADEDGKLQTGFVEQDGNRYFFDGAANLVSGWFKSEDNWYYANDDGIVMTGFLTLDGYRYYLNADGTRVSDTVMEIDGTTYIFSGDGSIDENATTMYPVYQYMENVRKEKGVDGEFLLDSKVQACAVLRASELVDGYHQEDDSQTLETLLKNRGVKCEGGYEFSYGGVEDYGIEQLTRDMEKDVNIQQVLQDSSITSVGLGIYVLNNVCYYDIIFTY
jgi:hypothetical protein